MGILLSTVCAAGAINSNAELERMLQTDLQDAHNQAAHHLIQEEQVAHHQAAHNEAQRGKQNQDVQQEVEDDATDTTNPPTDPPTYPPTLNHMKLFRRRRRAATKEPSTTPSKPLTLETKPLTRQVAVCRQLTPSWP